MSYFFYSIEEGNNIVVPDSLLTGTPLPSSSKKELDRMYTDFKITCEKDIKLQWHLIYLSDSWREKRIPRGLRIKKFPSFGLEDATFREQWEGILNKCSLDLILLIIEQTKKEKEKLQAKMDELKRQLTQASNESQQSSFENELKTNLDKFAMELKEYKLSKFRRDERDYAEGKVYTWKETTRRQPERRRRVVSFNLSTSEEEHDSTHEDTHGDFLGTGSHTKKAPQQKRKQKGRPGGGDVDPTISRESLRSRVRNQR